MDLTVLKELAAQFGFDAALTSTLVVIVVFLTNAVKDYIELGKPGIFVTVLVLSVGLNIACYASLGNWQAAIFGGVITAGLSLGGWSSVKKVAHKMATPKHE